MKVSNDDKVLFGAGGLGLILLAFLFWKKKRDQKANYLLTEEIESETVTPSKPASTPVQGAILDRNKLLKVGSKGIEVRELQRLLGVRIDGIFGSKETLPALQKSKGVSEISLNAFALKKKVIAASPAKELIQKAQPKKGEKLMAAKDNIKITTSKKIANGTYTNTGKNVWRTYDYGDPIGTFVSMNTAGFYLINLDGDYYFVNQNDVKTY